MKKFAKLMVILMFGLFAGTAWSSNIQIFETPTIEDAPLAGHKLIKFSLSWEYSWRTIDPNNWDAAWVFVKYRRGSEHWDHMYLDPTFAPTVENNNGVAMTHEYGRSYIPQFDEQRAVGVFLFRRENGRGHIRWETITLRWDYRGTGIYNPMNAATGSNITATDEITIRVFAIEMVYVREGAFFLGSGNNLAANGEFVRADRASTIAEPFLVTSEDAISIRARPGVAGFVDDNGVLNNHAGPVRPGGLSTASNAFTGNPSTAAPQANSIGLIGEDENGIPGAFPKGYRAFYSMKYEISQGAYVDFLNTLRVDQQVQRITTCVANVYLSAATVANTRLGCKSNASDRVWIKVMKQGIIEFGMDHNQNNILNEADDGEGIAMPLNTNDLMAYLDFAGLRPMTELEYEKACRGPNDPVLNEFAWGSTFWSAAPAGWAAGTANRADERPSTPFTNSFNTGAQASVSRNGVFANDSSGRMMSGATYWGIMEMSTNLRDFTISVTNAAGRGFTGEHGDGRITPNGSQDVVGWPNYFGWGWRGSYTLVPSVGSEHTVSNRITGWWNSGVVVNNNMAGAGNSWAAGGRGVRTAHTGAGGPNSSGS